MTQIKTSRRPKDEGNRVELRLGSGEHVNSLHDLAGRSTRPRATDGEPTLAARVIQLHAELSRLNHFELLEVPPNADTATVRAAFQRSARRYHPDRLRGDDQRLRPLAAQIFCRMSEAYRAIETESSREQYRRSLGLRAGGRPPRGERDDFDPERVFEAARICLEQGRLDDAMLLVRQLCDAAGNNEVKYLALHAWLQVLRGELRPGHTADRILRVLDRAVRERRDDMEVRLYRARTLERLGRMEDAYRDFAFVAAADPKNLDAARRVRLHQMRAGSKDKRSGVFPSLLSRKPPA